MKRKAVCPHCGKKSWNWEWDQETRNHYKGADIGSVSDPEYRDCAFFNCPVCKEETEGVIDPL